MPSKTFGRKPLDGNDACACAGPEKTVDLRQSHHPAVAGRDVRTKRRDNRSHIDPWQDCKGVEQSRGPVSLDRDVQNQAVALLQLPDTSAAQGEKADFSRSGSPTKPPTRGPK